MSANGPRDTTLTAPVDSDPTRQLRRVLQQASYEVMPFKGIEEKVLAHVPSDVRLTVTASPGKTVDDTVAMAIRFTEQGYNAAPHISARMLRDRSHLADLTAKLEAAGVHEVFVVGGDATPEGDFLDALSVLRALDEQGHHFTDIGFGGYPEGHAAIDDAKLWQALKDKAPYATYIATQVCFDAPTINTWAQQVRAHGVDLPVRIGMPGAVSRQKLMRIAGKIGLGDSARFLKKQQGMFWKFFTPGGYRPDKLIKALKPHLSESTTPLRGFHIFTFNDVEGTEAWRQKLLAGLGS